MFRTRGFVREVTSYSKEGEYATALREEITLASLPRRAAEPPPKGKRVNFRQALGKLLLTRDFELPGTKALGFRLIPTRKSIAGDKAIPFVFRMRLGKERLGLDVGGWF